MLGLGFSSGVSVEAVQSEKSLCVFFLEVGEGNSEIHVGDE